MSHYELLQFSIPKESEEFSILNTISTLHITQRKKNIQLLQVLGRKGVAFKDIRNHLMNESKRCGLWPEGKPESCLTKTAWYVAVVNYIIWSKKNFLDYNVYKEKPVKKAEEVTDKPKEIIIRREFSKAPQEIPSAGPKTEAENTKTKAIFNTNDVPLQRQSKDERSLDSWSSVIMKSKESQEPIALKTVTVEELKKQAQALKDKEEPSPVNIFRSVEESLTKIQIQTIVFQNLEILGQKALELGAGAQFNELMSAMGLYDEMLDGITEDLDIPEELGIELHS